MRLRNQQGISTFWGISIVLMEAVVVFFIFYILYFFWIENPVPTSNILIVRAITKQGVTIHNNIDTTGWLDYSNKNYGFSIKYPAGLLAKNSEINYGNYSGKIISFTEDGKEKFYLRIFKVKPEESIKNAFKRLTGVKPTAYQSFEEKVNKQPAIVFRQKVGDPASDHIYFIGNNYLFESAFNKFSAQILATFKFTNQ